MKLALATIVGFAAVGLALPQVDLPNADEAIVDSSAADSITMQADCHKHNGTVLYIC